MTRSEAEAALRGMFPEAESTYVYYNREDDTTSLNAALSPSAELSFDEVASVARIFGPRFDIESTVARGSRWVAFRFRGKL